MTKSKGPAAANQKIQYFENQHPVGMGM